MNKKLHIVNQRIYNVLLFTNILFNENAYLYLILLTDVADHCTAI